MTIPIKCPSCGNEKFVVVAASEPKTYDDLIGAVCSTCGHALTDEDVKENGRLLAEKLMKEFLTKKGF
jgi:hypothetical protein